MVICFHLFLEKKIVSNTVEEYGFDGCDIVFESAVIHPWKNVLHKSIMLSDHVLLDMPYREGLISNWLICRYLHYTRFSSTRMVQQCTEITTQAQYYQF